MSKVVGTRREFSGRSVLVDAKRLLLQPTIEFAVWNDFLKTRRTFRSIRNRATKDSKRVILVVVARDSIFELKSYLVFCQVLRQRGLRVVVLIQSRSMTRSVRYASALGADKLLFRTTLVHENPQRYRDRERIAKGLVANLESANDLKAVVHGDSEVGRHVFASAARELLIGSPDPNDPQVRPVVERLMVEAVTSVELGSHLNELISPEFVVLEEANYASSGPLVDTLTTSGTQVLQVVQAGDGGWIWTRLQKGARKLHPVSISTKTFDRILAEAAPPFLDRELDTELDQRYTGAYVLQAQNQPSNRQLDRKGLFGLLDIPTDRQLAVIYSHVLWDASLFFGTDIYDDYAQWLVETVRGAAENANLHWVVKAHPSNVFRVQHGDISGEAAEMSLLRREFPDLPEHVSVLPPDFDLSSMTLYQHADFGLTVRGTAGLEMATFSKPVLTCGTGHYIGQGFTLDSASRDEYQRRLATLHSLPPLPPGPTHRARLYAHALFLRRPLKPNLFAPTFDFPDAGFHPLDRNIAVSPSLITPEDVERDPDLRAFADWALGTEPEFLV